MPRKQKTSPQVYNMSVVIRLPGQPDDLDALVAHVKELFRLIVVDDYIFQLEEASRWHFQGTIKLKNKQRVRLIEMALNDLCDPPIRNFGVKPCSAGGAMALRNYCMKKDKTYRDGPWTKRPVYDGSDVSWITNQPRPFQQHILDILDEEPHDRHIHCYVNASGNIGKTRFFKCLSFTGRCEKIPMGTATQLKTNVIAKGASRAYVVDLPRSLGKEERLRDIFSAVEEVKAGWVEAAMHGKVHRLYMAPPHMFVMTNKMPNRALMSGDMWRMYTVDAPEAEVVFVPPPPPVAVATGVQTVLRADSIPFAQAS